MNSNTEHDQVRVCDIIGADNPWKAREFPRIRPSADHVVLYQVTGAKGKPLVAYKRQGDKWDDDYVRMPYSNWNEYDKGSFFTTKRESRWALIQKSLGKKITDSKALIGAILKYNGKFKDVWKFEALNFYLNSHLEISEREYFFKHTLPGIIDLALKLPDLIQAPIPLLKQNKCKSLSLSQAQIASLLANAFLCTFPRRNTTYNYSEAAKLPKINFALLYDGTENSVLQKLRCICNYFRRIISKPPTGVVTFSRRFVSQWQCPAWETCSDLIKKVPVYVDSEYNIENADGLIQVDFANKFLGGGVLGSGLVQEEIKFLMYPELMASMVFTESLGPEEALMIIGCERYNNCTGYGHESFRWGGDYCDTTPVDSSRRRRCAVLAIDAEPYWDSYKQFQKQKIERELNKAWIGFSFFGQNDSELLHPGVATGNWGCGAFNGAPQLKCLIQIMAAAVARRPLAYFTFGDRHFKEEVETAYDLCRSHDVTVGELFKCIVDYNYETDLHSFLKQKLKDKLWQYRNADNTKEFTRPQKESEHAQGNHLTGGTGFDSNAGPSTKDNYNSQKFTKETHQQERDNQNKTTKYAKYPSQNLSTSSQNFKYSEHARTISTDVSEDFVGRGHHSRKESSSNRSHKDQSQSLNKMSQREPHSRPRGSQQREYVYTTFRGRGSTQERQSTIQYNQVVNGTAQFKRQDDSTNIYEATGNIMSSSFVTWRRKHRSRFFPY